MLPDNNKRNGADMEIAMLDEVSKELRGMDSKLSEVEDNVRAARVDEADLGVVELNVIELRAMHAKLRAIVSKYEYETVRSPAKKRRVDEPKPNSRTSGPKTPPSTPPRPNRTNVPKWLRLEMVEEQGSDRFVRFSLHPSEQAAKTLPNGNEAHATARILDEVPKGDCWVVYWSVPKNILEYLKSTVFNPERKREKANLFFAQIRILGFYQTKDKAKEALRYFDSQRLSCTKGNIYHSMVHYQFP